MNLFSPQLECVYHYNNIMHGYRDWFKLARVLDCPLWLTSQHCSVDVLFILVDGNMQTSFLLANVHRCDISVCTKINLK